MKLQNLQEVLSAGGERVPHLVRLQQLIKEQIKPDVTQDQVIRFLSWMEATNMLSQFSIKDFMWITYEGMEALKGNPKAANDTLETYLDEDDLENSLKEVLNSAKKYFS